MRTPEPAVEREVVHDGAGWRWAAPDEPADGVLAAGSEFARLSFDPARTPVGPSVGVRAAAFWRFYDESFSAGIGPLEAPPDVLGG